MTVSPAPLHASGSELPHSKAFNSAAACVTRIDASRSAALPARLPRHVGCAAGAVAAACAAGRAARRPTPADGALRVLSPRDARILGALADRMTFTGDPSMPRFADTAGLQTIDTALLQLPPDVPQQLS